MKTTLFLLHPQVTDAQILLSAESAKPMRGWGVFLEHSSTLRAFNQFETDLKAGEGCCGGLKTQT